MSPPLTEPELKAAYCWEADDNVPRQPELTAFRRRLRYHQAQWREANGHPIGTQPIAPRAKDKVRPVGSRLPLDYGKETGANFLTANALAAARARTSFIEPHQSFDHQRLWADLLSSPALAFNLFGDLAADVERADRALHTWFPDVRGTVREVRFAHSPGRLDPSYLGNLVAWDVAFAFDDGIVGMVTAYQDVNRRQPPKPARLPRYREVMDRSNAFRPEAFDAVNGTELIHLWLDHLLVHSMLQHPNRECRWGKLVVVHPAGNVDFANACARYRDLLNDDSTFASVTLEGLLNSETLPRKTTAAMVDRYLPS